MYVHLDVFLKRIYYYIPLQFCSIYVIYLLLMYALIITICQKVWEQQLNRYDYSP